MRKVRKSVLIPLPHHQVNHELHEHDYLDPTNNNDIDDEYLARHSEFEKEKPAEPKPEDTHQLDNLEKEAAKRKEKKLKEHLEKIEYNKFPTILGWYFDGTFTSNFTLNEEFANYFQELEEELEAEQDMDIEETFTEKVNRNFWPPKWFGNFFRTRGVYLDFKEVKEDPPKTPPEMNFERQHAHIGVGLEDTGETDENKNQFGNAEYASESGRRQNDKRDNYYWTDETREFLLKEDDEEYEWWDHDHVWRKKEFHQRNPYSWYWHPIDGRYYVRILSRRDDYVFDQAANIYKKKGVEGPSKNGLGPHDYYYDEIIQKWLPLSQAKAKETEVYTNGKREIKKGPRGKTGLGSDDFYYSGETGRMEPKNEHTPMDYFYDTKDQMFKKHGDPYGPGKTGLYPTDYKFSDKDGMWLPKPPREFYKPSPYDWYFDAAIGRFFSMDKTQRSDYEFDHAANVWKKKGVKGPSANSLGPEDYVYDEQAKIWKLENAFENAEEIEPHTAGKRKVRKGIRGKTGKIADHFYYDSQLGEFLPKSIEKLDNYFYDTYDEVFRKKEQPFGPGKSKLLPCHFYFDEIEGEWLQTLDAKTFLALQKQTPKVIPAPHFQTPYDYAFDNHTGTFVFRDKNNPHNYLYDASDGVYTRKGTQGPSLNGKKVRDYYFDEHVYNWMPLESPKGHEAKDYKNGKRNNRTGKRGKTGLIPDDFYFSEGKFSQKDHSSPEKYRFDHENGVWKLIEPPANDVLPKMNVPADFYFSYEDGAFLLKKDLKFGEIFLDKNSKIWTQILRVPQDYFWDAGKMMYKLKPGRPPPEHGTGQQGTGVQGDGKGIGPPDQAAGAKKLDTENDYDKPWLNKYPHLAATKERYTLEVKKIKKKKLSKKANKNNTQPTSAPTSAPTENKDKV